MRPGRLSVGGEQPDARLRGEVVRIVVELRGRGNRTAPRLRTQVADEDGQTVLVGWHPALIDHTARPGERAPPRAAGRPVDSNELLLHEGTPLGRERPRGWPRQRTRPSS